MGQHNPPSPTGTHLTGARQSSCRWCGKTFKSNRKLKKHQDSDHQERIKTVLYYYGTLVSVPSAVSFKAKEIAYAIAFELAGPIISEDVFYYFQYHFKYWEAYNYYKAGEGLTQKLRQHLHSHGVYTGRDGDDVEVLVALSRIPPAYPGSDEAPLPEWPDDADDDGHERRRRKTVQNDVNQLAKPTAQAS
jgi:hypothetical protein